MSMTRWPYSTARAAWLATAHKANRLRNLYVPPRNVRSRRRADPGASGYALRPRIGDQVKPDNLCATEPDSSICYRHSDRPRLTPGITVATINLCASLAMVQSASGRYESAVSTCFELRRSLPGCT